MRLILIRVETNRYNFIWSSYHALLDGWSTTLLLQEVWNCYEALCQHQQVRLKASRPYRDYIAWLQQQDSAQAETYWRQMLSDWDTPTSLGVDHPPTGTTEEFSIKEHLL